MGEEKKMKISEKKIRANKSPENKDCFICKTSDGYKVHRFGDDVEASILLEDYFYHSHSGYNRKGWVSAGEGVADFFKVNSFSIFGRKIITDFTKRRQLIELSEKISITFNVLDSIFDHADSNNLWDLVVITIHWLDSDENKTQVILKTKLSNIQEDVDRIMKSEKVSDFISKFNTDENSVELRNVSGYTNCDTRREETVYFINCFHDAPVSNRAEWWKFFDNAYFIHFYWEALENKKLLSSFDEDVINSLENVGVFPETKELAILENGRVIELINLCGESVFEKLIKLGLVSRLDDCSEISFWHTNGAKKKLLIGSENLPEELAEKACESDVKHSGNTIFYGMEIQEEAYMLCSEQYKQKIIKKLKAAKEYGSKVIKEEEEIKKFLQEYGEIKIYMIDRYVDAYLVDPKHNFFDICEEKGIRNIADFKNHRDHWKVNNLINLFMKKIIELEALYNKDKINECEFQCSYGDFAKKHLVEFFSKK